MAQWDSPPSAPAGLLAKLDRIAREPPPIPPRISQHPFYAESTPWTDVPAATRPELDRLGLWDSVRHLKDKGYAVIPDPAPASDIVALREAVASGWSSRPKVTTALLGVDPVYELAATNPVVAAMAEASLGQGFLLSSMGSSRVRQVDDDPAKRRTQGEELHCDQFMLPAPFPLQSQTLVFCWALNCPFPPENGPPPPLPRSSPPFPTPALRKLAHAEVRAGGWGAGATKVVEGSHHLRRHPTAAESASAAEISQPILAPEGALTCCAQAPLLLLHSCCSCARSALLTVSGLQGTGRRGTRKARGRLRASGWCCT